MVAVILYVPALLYVQWLWQKEKTLSATVNIQTKIFVARRNFGRQRRLTTGQERFSSSSPYFNVRGCDRVHHICHLLDQNVCQWQNFGKQKSWEESRVHRNGVPVRIYSPEYKFREMESWRMSKDMTSAVIHTWCRDPIHGTTGTAHMEQCTDYEWSVDCCRQCLQACRTCQHFVAGHVMNWHQWQ